MGDALEQVFVVDPEGGMHFQLDRSHLLSLSPDGQASEFEIPSAEPQVRLVLSLVPSKNGLLVILVEGLNEVDRETARATGLFAMENPKEAAYLLAADGLRIAQPELRARIIGQLEDGKWLKVKFTACRAVFSIEDEL